MHNPGISRRALLQAAGVGAAGAAFGLGAPRRAFAADLTVGIVYVGARDDFGWNQAHAVAAAALKLVPGVKVIEEENVPETDAVAATFVQRMFTSYLPPLWGWFVLVGMRKREYL